MWSLLIHKFKFFYRIGTHVLSHLTRLINYLKTFQNKNDLTLFSKQNFIAN